MRWSRLAFIAACSSLLPFAPGCLIHEAELARADEHFAHEENEKTLATVRALDNDWALLDVTDRGRYCYIRGMTDYRIGFRADARHWLALALEIEREKPGSLAPEAKKIADEKLAELNAIVWSGDVLAIDDSANVKKKSAAAPTGDDDSPKPKAKKPADEDDSPKPKTKKPADEDDSPKPRKKTAD